MVRRIAALAVPAGRGAAAEKQTGRRKGGGEVYEKSLEMRHFRVLHTRKRKCRRLARPLQSVGMERMKETAPTEVFGCTIEGAQEVKSEILVKT